MTNNVDHRNRVRAGVKTAGQFAAEVHQEPANVTLTPQPSQLDKAAVAGLADMVRTRAAYEHGKWQRRHDRGYMGDLPAPPLPPELVDLNRQADEFETLPRQEQEEVLDKLTFSGAKHLLEPGQTLGNDRVLVDEDLDPDKGNVSVALSAQKLIADAGISGTVTMTHIGDWTKFTVEDGNLKHDLKIGRSLLSFGCEDPDGDYTQNNWLYRADASMAGGDLLAEGRADDLRKHYEEHREYAVMMDAVASSSFRDAEDHIGVMDRKYRTAELKVDGTEYVLDVSGDEPSLRGDGDTTLHPSMVPGFLNHMATRTGHPDGNALVSDLREVFRETDRRLIP